MPSGPLRVGSAPRARQERGDGRRAGGRRSGGWPSCSTSMAVAEQGSIRRRCRLRCRDRRRAGHAAAAGPRASTARCCWRPGHGGAPSGWFMQPRPDAAPGRRRKPRTHRVGDASHPVLSDQPVHDGLHGLPLSGGSIVFLQQHALDRVLERGRAVIFRAGSCLRGGGTGDFSAWEHHPAAHSVAGRPAARMEQAAERRRHAGMILNSAALPGLRAAPGDSLVAAGPDVHPGRRRHIRVMPLACLPGSRASRAGSLLSLPGSLR